MNENDLMEIVKRGDSIVVGTEAHEDVLSNFKRYTPQVVSLFAHLLR